MFITRGPGTKLCAGERGKGKDMCSGILLAAACVDESDHLTLVNAAREGERGAAEGEGGGCCCASAIAIAHMRLAHRARENKYMDSA